MAPEIEEVDETDPGNRLGFVEDAADVDMRTEAERLAEEDALFRRQTQVIQRGLPVPSDANRGILRTSAPQNAEQQADEIVKAEMLELIKRDAGLDTTASVDDFTEDEIEAAKKELEAEIEYVAEAMGHSSLEEAHVDAWQAMQREALFLPSEKRYGRFSGASARDKLNSIELHYKKVYSLMEKDFKRCAKSEKKLGVLTNGYQKKTNASLIEMKALADQVDQSTIKLCSYVCYEFDAVNFPQTCPFHRYELLAENESIAMPWRQQQLEHEVRQLEEREADLQSRFQLLLDERDALYTAAAKNSLGAATVSRAAVTMEA